MDYGQAIEWLDSHLDHETAPSGVVAGKVEGLSLEPMRHLMVLLGDPQDQVPSIHITGTNGKGAVAAMVTALLSANGLSVGTYSSPHIASINERICRNGQPISDEDFAEVLTGIAAVEELLPDQLSWFELVTAAAFRWFAEVPVEVAVVEVGLLGRHDATNVIDAQVAVITAVQGDHTDFAPGWEYAVATEKAGIISPNSTAVLGVMDDELAAVFEAEGPVRALRGDIDFEIFDDRVALGGHLVGIRGPFGTYEDVFLPVHGAHQVANAALALAVVEAFFERALDPEIVREAFAGLEIRGRFEVVGHKPLSIIDGAHNNDAILAAAKTLDQEFTPAGRRVLVFGALEGRDLEHTVEALVQLRPDLVIATSLAPPRGIPSESIQTVLDRYGIACESVDDPFQAVQHAIRISDEEDLIMVIGSFRLIEPARRAFGL